MTEDGEERVGQPQRGHALQPSSVQHRQLAIRGGMTISGDQIDDIPPDSLSEHVWGLPE